MHWKILGGVLIVAMLAYGGYRIAGIASSLSLPSTEEEIAAVQAVAKQQIEDRHYRPKRQKNAKLPANPLNNLYFGELHVHTSISADAYLFGNRLNMDAAYRFAKGERIELRTGETAELTRPLDFVALTDHAEAFGRIAACAEAKLSEAASDACHALEQPSVFGFLELRRRAEQRPVVRRLEAFNGDPKLAQEFAKQTWQEVKDAARRHYKPGEFTTFIGYEYSPALPDRGKHHRNVIFKSETTPDHAVSAIEAASEIDLWKQLDSACTDDCEFLTIPHNPNKTWGLAFAGVTIDGIKYNEDDWALRDKFEPLVEMFQNKGNSECSVAFGAGDEECGFEQFLPPCEEGQTTSCIHPTSMIRDGLHIGLELEDEIGINPLQFGLIGATDTHNSNPGDTEEWDYRGVTTFTSSPAAQRMNVSDITGIRDNNPGGLAAVWAPENTREALFESMKRKEVYATSGTRIKLRTFAGFNLPSDLAETGDLEAAYANGVPMGGSLPAQEQAFSIFVWATQDPDNAPLARAQVVKGWIEDGERQERVYDIACGGSQLSGTSGKCLPNGATVYLQDCRWDTTVGASELKALWTDPDYSPNEDAFYYVRIVQNPTCRWTTYDSIRLGQTPPKDSPATSTEMAWSSPFWVKAPES
ncbi:MAG: DUF3604 domain-containing protein [Gammaproteobacteria bacterium]